MKGDELPPFGCDVPSLPRLEVWRGVAPCLPAMGTTIGNPVLVSMGFRVPMGRGWLSESRESGGDCEDCDKALFHCLCPCFALLGEGFGDSSLPLDREALIGEP